MNPEFEAKLRAQVDFPSPSKVASEIIALARNPDADLNKIAAVTGRDPALAAKLLRIANSAFYAQRRPSQTIKQALVVMGLNAALTLALSFSLVSMLRGCRPNGINYRRYWRQSLLAATAARCLADHVCRGKSEETFLAGLLQDIAALAIDRIEPSFYQAVPENCGHQRLVEFEQVHLEGKDHSYYSALLLRQWNLPETLCQAVAFSHSPNEAADSTDDGKIARCVALGSALADAILTADRMPAMTAVAAQAEALLGLSPEKIGEIVNELLRLIPETQELYETTLLDPSDAETLTQQARELMTLRNLSALRDMQALQETTALLLGRTEELEDKTRRDPLTDTLNRLWLERVLEREHTQAVMFGRSLSVALINLDHFRRVNESLGHEAGNRVLKRCADVIQANVRGSDLIGRFSGDTFLVLLPGTDEGLAAQVGTRILTSLRDIQHPTHEQPIQVTVSIGIATYTPTHRFNNANDLLSAADHAMYRAKLSGRDRLVSFDPAQMAVPKSVARSA